MASFFSIAEEKILDGRQLQERLVPRSTRLVHCHGCFDLLHVGHMHHFAFAKSLGDCLLVSLNDDAHFPNKGDGRPFFTDRLRAMAIASLAVVDYVTIYPDFLPTRLFETLRPDIYVKGIEYHPDRYPTPIPEAAIVEGYGGKVAYGPAECVFSSTKLIQQLQRTVGREAIR